MKLNKQVGVFIAFIIMPSAFIASIPLYMIIQNNNQGEAYNTISGDYEYLYLSKIFLIVFAEVFLIIIAIVAFFSICDFYYRQVRKDKAQVTQPTE